jgi:hypothetical protein
VTGRRPGSLRAQFLHEQDDTVADHVQG